MIKRIAYTKPSVTKLELDYASDAVANGWGEACYDYIKLFEKKFSEHLSVKHAIATSSCTGALHLGLAAIGVGPGDEVIIADTNWIASVAPVCHLSASPVFVDIDPVSWCLDPNKVESAITSRTKAIIAVHLYGNPADMAALRELANLHDIYLIEDAAEAIGTVIGRERAGSLGDFGVFSFHGTKTLTTGEGGMFVTSDSSLYEKVLTLSNHGRKRNQIKQFYPEGLGFKYKMSNVQAAIGCGQLERVEDLIARKRDILAYYKDRLCDIAGTVMNPEPPGTINGAWMPTIVFPKETGISSEKLMKAFKLNNIDARPFFYPLSSLNMFKSCIQNKVSWDIYRRAINLPSFHDMTEPELDKIVKIVRSMVTKYAA